MGAPRVEPVRDYLMSLQDTICKALEVEDGVATFDARELERERGGIARPRVLEGGRVFEKAGVNFSHARGASLPPAATARKPEMAGAPFEAVSTSLIIHPVNPHVPTSHANFRFFIATPEQGDPIWWFGGGFDLTPYYGYDEDCRAWHRTAKAACDPFGETIYPRFKQWCDEYFFLKHRAEPRGIGGLFFDDWSEGGFDASFELVRSCGDAFLEAYMPIVRRRRETEYTEAQRRFQLYRRGRYVEFNLIYDRGTLYGLQSGGRVESILASMPPLVRWEYDYRAPAGSAEARLTEHFLQPQDWAAE